MLCLPTAWDNFHGEGGDAELYRDPGRVGWWRWGVWGWELSACYTACRMPSWELLILDSVRCQQGLPSGERKRRGVRGEEGWGGNRESKREARGEKKPTSYSPWLTNQRANGDLIITDFIRKMTNASVENSVGSKKQLNPIYTRLLVLHQWGNLSCSVSIPFLFSHASFIALWMVMSVCQPTNLIQIK